MKTAFRKIGEVAIIIPLFLEYSRTPEEGRLYKRSKINPDILYPNDEYHALYKRIGRIRATNPVAANVLKLFSRCRFLLKDFSSRHILKTEPYK